MATCGLLDRILAVTPREWDIWNYRYIVTDDWGTQLAKVVPDSAAQYGGGLEIEVKTGKVVTNIRTTTSALVYYTVRVDIDEKSSHANVVLIDRYTKTGELFEPHGEAKWSGVVAEALKKELPELASPEYHYWQPLDYCPTAGPQTTSGDSNCASWTLLYLALRLACPRWSREEVIKAMNIESSELLAKWNTYLMDYTRVAEYLANTVSEIETYQSETSAYGYQVVKEQPTISPEAFWAKIRAADVEFQLFKARLEGAICSLSQLPPVPNTGDESKKEYPNYDHLPLREVRLGDYYAGYSTPSIPIELMGVLTKAMVVPHSQDPTKPKVPMQLAVGSILIRCQDMYSVWLPTGEWRRINSYIDSSVGTISYSFYRMKEPPTIPELTHPARR